MTLSINKLNKENAVSWKSDEKSINRTIDESFKEVSFQRKQKNEWRKRVRKLCFEDNKNATIFFFFDGNYLVEREKQTKKERGVSC